MDSNWLIGYKETDDQKIYGIECLFATHVCKIYIMEHVMDHLWPMTEKQIEIALTATHS